MKKKLLYNFKIRKKMNLEKLNLVELDAQEAVATEGGFWPAIIVGALIEAVLTEDLDNLSKAFNQGYNSTRNP